MKDWIKSGYTIESIDPLPEYDAEFISAEELLHKLQESELNQCAESGDEPIITILDLRTENFSKSMTPKVQIKTECHTVKMLFDDLSKPEPRNKIPKKGLVVTVTETGNRDAAVIRYLSKYGYTNIKGLKFGMRGWIKLNYSITSEDRL